MPPANSPSVRLPNQYISTSLTTAQETPADNLSRSPYLADLAELARAPPDFAATLTTPAEDQANEDNVNFLRTSISQYEPGTGSPSRRHAPYLSARQHEQRRTELERRAHLAHMRRYVSSQRQELDRTLRLQLGYQGWAPGTSDNEMDDPQLALSELRAFVRGQRSREDTATRRHQREQQQWLQPSGTRWNTLDDDMDWETSRFVENDPMNETNLGEQSLRTTALLQSVRRHARFSPQMWNHPDNSGQLNENGERSSSNRVTRTRSQQRRDPLEDMRSRIAHDLHRARRIHDMPTDSSLRWLEEAIKYLERLRFCDTYSDRISSAEASGFFNGEYFTYGHDDFILDTKIISPPKPSSWLRVGGIFSGSQHANTQPPHQSSGLSRSRRLSGSTRLAEHGSTAEPATTSNPSHTLRSSSWAANILSRNYRNGEPNTNNSTNENTAPESTDDSWPVKVTINSIDYETMTLTGTMEAINVPNKSSPAQESSITTYLEGEIIDFNQYTLETKSFNANPSVDSKYWRSLEPFKDLTDNEVVSNLVSMKWMCEELGQKWILMRWKGKLFSYYLFAILPFSFPSLSISLPVTILYSPYYIRILIY